VNGTAAVPGRPEADLLLGPPAAAGGDGERAARALGLTPSDGSGPLDRVAGASGAGHRLGARASAVLWPATWGYFLDHMLTGLLPDPAREQLRQHAVGHLRAAGTLPLLQVANQPYGLWPVTSLSRFAPAADDRLGRQLAALLRGLREKVWRPAAAGIPRLDPAALAADESSDPSGALAKILAQRGRSLGVRRRALFGGAYAGNLSSLLAGTPVDPGAWERRRSAAAWLATQLVFSSADTEAAAAALAADDVATLLELADVGRLADAKFAREAADVALPIVGDGRTVRTEVGFLLERGWREVRAGNGPSSATSVLSLLLRHAALRSYIDAAAALLELAPEQRAEPELIAVHGRQDTAWDVLERTLRDGRTVGDALDRQRSDPTAAGLGEFDDFWAGLRELSELDDAAWEPLLADVLDTCSHRLDAWVTSLADRALAKLRAARPTGVAVGGYGWVTDLGVTPARRLRAQVAEREALRDAAARAVEAARRATAAVVAARTNADTELAEAQRAQQELELEVARLNSVLERLNRVVNDPRLARVNIETRIRQTAKALAERRAAVPAATERVRAAREALASAQQREAEATGREALPDATLNEAEGDLAEARRQLGQARAGTEEFLHAPSLQQASTAAVLRSGYLAHRSDAGAGHAPFSVDLSSARVRQAAHLAEGVRAGQPPAALLGYQLERDLRDRGLANLILALRTMSPYGELTAAEVEQVRLRNIADGSATALEQLRERLRAAEAADSTRAEWISARQKLEEKLTAARSEEQRASAAIEQPIPALLRPGFGFMVRDQTRAAVAVADAEATARTSADPSAQMRLEEARRREQWTSGLLTNAASRNPLLARVNIGQLVSRHRDAARALADAMFAYAHLGPEPAAPNLAELEDQLKIAEAADKQAQDGAAAADKLVEDLQASLRHQAAEAAAASSVVDGLAVLQRYRQGRDGGVWDASTLPLGSELPAAGSDDGKELLAPSPSGRPRSTPSPTPPSPRPCTSLSRATPRERRPLPTRSRTSMRHPRSKWSAHRAAGARSRTAWRSWWIPSTPPRRPRGGLPARLRGPPPSRRSSGGCGGGCRTQAACVQRSSGSKRTVSSARRPKPRSRSSRWARSTSYTGPPATTGS
jgi:hypothetical protein